MGTGVVVTPILGLVLLLENPPAVLDDPGATELTTGTSVTEATGVLLCDALAPITLTALLILLFVGLEEELELEVEFNCDRESSAAFVPIPTPKPNPNATARISNPITPNASGRRYHGFGLLLLLALLKADGM